MSRFHNILGMDTGFLLCKVKTVGNYQLEYERRLKRQWQFLIFATTHQGEDIFKEKREITEK